MVMNNSYKIQIGLPLKNNKLKQLKSFLSKNDLTYDNNISYSVIILDNFNKIIATGSIDDNIIKCIAIDKNHRNENLTSIILTHIINESIKRNLSNLFIFSKLENEKIFNQFGFHTIEKTNEIVLMETKKNGFSNYLKKIKKESSKYQYNKNDKIGCIIANCNPFTNGHLYLMQEAAKNCKLLHLFILDKDNDFFTFEERFLLVKKGIKDIDNIILHKASDYILSPLTFPTYFLKDKKQTTNINCKLDIKIFLNNIVPLLNINYRYVGTEPNDLVTNSYNQELIKNLKDSLVNLVIIDRKNINGDIISASKVRKLIEINDLPSIKKYVPISTYEFIKLKFFDNASSKK